MREIPISLYSGAGNEFVVIDAFNDPLIVQSIKLKALAQTVSNRKGIIGSDGMIVLARSPKAAFMMNFYNPDGSFGALCGNGARCAVQAAFDAGIIQDRNTNFEVLGEVVRAESYSDDVIRVYYSDPKYIKLKFKLSIGAELVTCHYVDMGSQHAVIFFEDIEQLRDQTIEDFDIAKYGSFVRNHDDLKPLGANANFIEVREDADGKYLRIRTFERGVEGETLACGTGCMSSSIVAYALGRIDTLPIRLLTQSGEFVKVGFQIADQHVHDLWLEGSARLKRRGIVYVNNK
jgi:diaminopimelate epimerase